MKLSSLTSLAFETNAIADSLSSSVVPLTKEDGLLWIPLIAQNQAAGRTATLRVAAPEPITFHSSRSGPRLSALGLPNSAFLIVLVLVFVLVLVVALIPVYFAINDRPQKTT